MCEKKVLVVGLACLDYISVCESFPLEDTDQRCVDSEWQLGGNAANTSAVLAELGSDVEYAGVFGNDFISDYLRQAFRVDNVKTSNCQVENCGTPTSAVIVNRGTGSRTILHHNPGLPEVSFCHFETEFAPRLKSFDWIHFEGRNTGELLKIIPDVRKLNPSATVSVELEKTRSELLALIPLADVVFLSKEFSKFNGCHDMIDSVKYFRDLAKKDAVMICAWGEFGACALERDELVQSPAFPPEKVVDTLGAGDTFNAAFIFARRKGCWLKKSLEFACRVAGTKCGQNHRKGFGKLVDFLD